MTLSKGNVLFKRGVPGSGASFADRVREWLETEEAKTGEPSAEALAQLLCPNESYVVHEVMNDVHYKYLPVPPQDVNKPTVMQSSFAEGVDLKVLK